MQVDDLDGWADGGLCVADLNRTSIAGTLRTKPHCSNSLLIFVGPFLLAATRGAAGDVLTSVYLSLFTRAESDTPLSLSLFSQVLYVNLLIIRPDVTPG